MRDDNLKVPGFSFGTQSIIRPLPTKKLDKPYTSDSIKEIIMTNKDSEKEPRKYLHPKLKGFFEKYTCLGDLVPMVEVKGCADWYEDYIGELQKENEELKIQNDKYYKLVQSLSVKLQASTEENQTLKAQLALAVSAAGELLNNYEMEPQNEHNDPTIKWKYINNLRKALQSIKETKAPLAVIKVGVDVLSTEDLKEGFLLDREGPEYRCSSILNEFDDYKGILIVLPNEETKAPNGESNGT